MGLQLPLREGAARGNDHSPPSPVGDSFQLPEGHSPLHTFSKWIPILLTQFSMLSSHLFIWATSSFLPQAIAIESQLLGLVGVKRWAIVLCAVILMLKLAIIFKGWSKISAIDIYNAMSPAANELTWHLIVSQRFEVKLDALWYARPSIECGSSLC